MATSLRRQTKLDFTQKPKIRFFTSESVSPGHPDKLCDLYSDLTLDEILRRDPLGKGAVESAAGCDYGIPWFRQFGEHRISDKVANGLTQTVEQLFREALVSLRYDSPLFCLDGHSCPIQTVLNQQSQNIYVGIDRGQRDRVEKGILTDEEISTIGAGDQGMMIGFACIETPRYMPMPIDLAHALMRQQALICQLGENGPMPYMGPDAKSQVTVKYDGWNPVGIDTIVVSTQHTPEVVLSQIRQDVIEYIIRPVLGDLFNSSIKIFVNPTGIFCIGGPMGDSGLTGRKIIVDTYGGMARHGGGAFSGKDPTKVDRSAAYAARHIAKNIVAAGLADRLELQISYAIGVARPLSLFVETYGTGRVSDDEIIRLINEHFDLRPAGIIQSLNLRRPIYRPTAAFGHFGHEYDPITGLYPWENLDKVAKLRQAVGEDVNSKLVD